MLPRVGGARQIWRHILWTLTMRAEKDLPIDECKLEVLAPRCMHIWKHDGHG
jgi:hypothetical protein